MHGYPTQAEAAIPRYADEVAERTNIVKEFEWATTELASVVEQLSQTLGPVLRPDYPDATAKMSEPSPEVSAARSQLHVLQEQTGRIRYLLDRLEV